MEGRTIEIKGNKQVFPNDYVFPEHSGGVSLIPNEERKTITIMPMKEGAIIELPIEEAQIIASIIHDQAKRMILCQTREAVEAESKRRPDEAQAGTIVEIKPGASIDDILSAEEREEYKRKMRQIEERSGTPYFFWWEDDKPEEFTISPAVGTSVTIKRKEYAEKLIRSIESRLPHML